MPPIEPRVLGAGEGSVSPCKFELRKIGTPCWSIRVVLLHAVCLHTCTCTGAFGFNNVFSATLSCKFAGLPGSALRIGYAYIYACCKGCGQ